MSPTSVYRGGDIITYFELVIILLMDLMDFFFHLNVLCQVEMSISF